MHNPEMLRMKCLTGHMVETVIVNEIMKSYDNNCVEWGFHYYREWYEALGDAVFVSVDPWRNYWYVVDARTDEGVCRVHFKIPGRYFQWVNGPKYNENFGWGHFVEDVEWIPRERWANRPKGYALNYSVKGRRRSRWRT